ncbi:MAG: ArnT family glycosyltransferase [Kiloniellales bacterium]
MPRPKTTARLAGTERAVMSRNQIAALFLAAVLIRLAYVGVVVLLDGSFDNGSDSGKYLIRASNLLQYGAIVYWDHGVLIPDTARMPLYPYFLAGVLGAIGEDALWAVAVLQAFIDAATVIAVGLIAGLIDRRWAVPAAALACVWTTMVVYSSFVLTDTLFLAFFAWGLCACLWAVRSQRKVVLLIAAGACFGLAVLTRPILIFFPYLLMPALACMLWAAAGLGWRRAIGLAAIPALLLAAALMPRLGMTYAHYGAPVVTTQTGNQALDVVDQFLRLCPQCVAERREQGMHAKVAALLDQEDAADRRNPLVLDRIRREVAFEYLKELPPLVVLRGVLTAVLRSTLQTGLYEAGYQLNRNPMFFSAAPGASLAARIWNFAKAVLGDGYLFAWALAQAAVLIGFALQLGGVVAGVRDPGARPFVMFLMAVAAYFLALNGPFGNPRYGMPLAPTLVVLTVAGGFLVWRRLANRRI